MKKQMRLFVRKPILGQMRNSKSLANYCRFAGLRQFWTDRLSCNKIQTQMFPLNRRKTNQRQRKLEWNEKSLIHADIYCTLMPYSICADVHAKMEHNLYQIELNQRCPKAQKHLFLLFLVIFSYLAGYIDWKAIFTSRNQQFLYNDD